MNLLIMSKPYVYSANIHPYSLRLNSTIRTDIRFVLHHNQMLITAKNFKYRELMQLLQEIN